MRLLEHIDGLLRESTDDWPRPSRGGLPVPKPPQQLTLREFVSWEPPEPSRGRRFLYHATDRRNVEKIAKEGIRADLVKSPPAGTIWATTDPKGYSKTKDVVWFEVDEDDMVEYVAGNQAMVRRSIPPEDIVYIDLYYPPGFDHYSEVRTSEYAEQYWRDANGIVESVQRETSKVDASTKEKLKNLKPTDRVTVYHGTSTSYLQDFLDGLDLTSPRRRQYGGPKHAGLFVSPSFDEATRFGPNLVFELKVPAKMLYGVDWDGRTRADGVRRGVSPEQADEWYPNSFRPYLTATMLQSSEPQGIILGRLKEGHISRIWYKDRWWTPDEMFEHGVEYYPKGDRKPKKLRRLGFDPNDSSLSPEEFFKAVSQAIDRDPERVERYLGIYAKAGKEELANKLMDGFGFKIGRNTADKMAKKLVRYFGLSESLLLSEGTMDDVSFEDVMNHAWQGGSPADHWLALSTRLDHEFANNKTYSDLHVQDVPMTMEFKLWRQAEYTSYEDSEAVKAFLRKHGRDVLDMSEINVVRDTRSFKDWTVEWAEGKFDDVKWNLYRKVGKGRRITLWREMKVKDDWLNHLKEDGKHLGIYWSWDRSGADTYWGHQGRGSSTALIQSSIRSDRVDWVETIARNMDPDLGDMEKEIRLFKNTPLKIERLWIDGKEVELGPLADKKFRA